jgi:hypothetical protein
MIYRRGAGKFGSCRKAKTPLKLGGALSVVGAADQAAFCSVICGRGSTFVPILIVRGLAGSGNS